ncbi:hypothetical protein CYMTET_7788 [Cymbomonas tetramitiformis]|uniref:Uncharacterized protein n=1 Tax=Cymbomonas tetramitiformis TaxID=36881 RepID=A0AAE0GUK0_9CHLO|nr:hypothetical protein CYMTET_7788 [Cymbomonas tetramitiformis]
MKHVRAGNTVAPDANTDDAEWTHNPVDEVGRSTSPIGLLGVEDGKWSLEMDWADQLDGRQLGDAADSSAVATHGDQRVGIRKNAKRNLQWQRIF